jgi:hypothetical protein
MAKLTDTLRYVPGRAEQTRVLIFEREDKVSGIHRRTSEACENVFYERQCSVTGIGFFTTFMFTGWFAGDRLHAVRLKPEEPPPPPSYNHCSDRKFYLNLKCNAFCVHITVFLFGCLSLLKIWELLFFFVSKKITMLFLTVGRCWGDTQAIQAVFLLDWWLSHQDDRKSLNFPACELQSFNHGQAFYWMTP